MAFRVPVPQGTSGRRYGQQSRRKLPIWLKLLALHACTISGPSLCFPADIFHFAKKKSEPCAPDVTERSITYQTGATTLRVPGLSGDLIDSP